jgi:hypothetical protein
LFGFCCDGNDLVPGDQFSISAADALGENRRVGFLRAGFADDLIRSHSGDKNGRS